MEARILNQAPAEKLEGRVLPGGWTVIERLTRDPVRYHESRTSCYRAINQQGHEAFVKAFDFRHEDVSIDPRQLSAMLSEFLHERDVHELCRDRGLRRVTRIRDASKVIVDGQAVHLLVCEYAPQSLREALPPGAEDVEPWIRLEALRKVASGLAQLHGIGVAHQDIKASNAVAYPDGEVKITDLGSSSCRTLPPAPHDAFSFCGQPGFAPYELLYSHEGDWNERRIGCDMFLLGNLIFTSFVGCSLTTLLLHTIPEPLRHGVHDGAYDLVLPHLLEMHYEIVPMAIAQHVPVCIRDEFTKLILCMCNPDPSRRGRTLNARTSSHPFALERCISALNLMAMRARLNHHHVS